MSRIFCGEESMCFYLPSVNYGSLKCRCNFKFEIELISRLILNLTTSRSESCKDFNSFLLLYLRITWCVCFVTDVQCFLNPYQTVQIPCPNNNGERRGYIWLVVRTESVVSRQHEVGRTQKTSLLEEDFHSRVYLFSHANRFYSHTPASTERGPTLTQISVSRTHEPLAFLMGSWSHPSSPASRNVPGEALRDHSNNVCVGLRDECRSYLQTIELLVE